MSCPTLKQLPSPQYEKKHAESNLNADWPWTKETPQLLDGSSLPRISIVTPSYNQGQFIEETIRSVLLQGYPNLEYIIIDGGSTDNSVELIKKYEPWLTYWTSEKDRGQSHAINKGFQRVTGEIFAWLNSDDFFLPGALQRVAAEFHAQNGLAMMAGECINVDIAGVEISRKQSNTFDPLVVLISGKPAQPATFFHRRMLDEIGFLREDLHYPLDREYILRIGQHHYPKNTLNINVPLASARIWDGAKTPTSNHRQAIEESKRVINMYLHLSPNSQRKLRNLAYRRVYINQAVLENENGNTFKELLYWARAVYYMRDLPHIKKFFGRVKNVILRSWLVNQLRQIRYNFSGSHSENM
ncbi:glycosyltransferase [candidate division KSB1 bacterium]|nr:glycosyltransferase [candidate division KSB1 bacterium]